VTDVDTAVAVPVPIRRFDDRRRKSVRDPKFRAGSDTLFRISHAGVCVDLITEGA
jgi:hypothetical protein